MKLNFKKPGELDHFVVEEVDQEPGATYHDAPKDFDPDVNTATIGYNNIISVVPLPVESMEIPSSAPGENIGNSDLEINSENRQLKLMPYGHFHVKASDDTDLMKISENGRFETKILRLVNNVATVFGNIFKISKKVSRGLPGSYGDFDMAKITADENNLTIENGYDPIRSGGDQSFNFVNHAPKANPFEEGGTTSVSGGFKFYHDWVADNKLAYAIKSDGKIEHYFNSNFALPEEGPKIENGYIQMADQTNEVTHVTFFDSNGNAVKLFRQNLPSNPTNSEIATFLSNIGLATLTE